MYRQNFSTSSEPVDFSGALVQITRPKQMFVEHVDYLNQAAVHRRMLPDVHLMLNLFSISPGTSLDQAIIATISATDVNALLVCLAGQYANHAAHRSTSESLRCCATKYNRHPSKVQ